MAAAVSRPTITPSPITAPWSRPACLNRRASSSWVRAWPGWSWRGGGAEIFLNLTSRGVARFSGLEVTDSSRRKRYRGPSRSVRVGQIHLGPGDSARPIAADRSADGRTATGGRHAYSTRRRRSGNLPSADRCADGETASRRQARPAPARDETRFSRGAAVDLVILDAMLPDEDRGSASAGACVPRPISRSSC